MDLNSLFKISYGVYIITSRLEEKTNGMIATTVCQVTAEPVRVTIAINKNNFSHDMIEKSGVFGISVLSMEADFPFIGRFGFRSGRNVDKLQGVEYIRGKTGVPLVTEKCTAVFEGKVIDKLDAGTHTIFLGELVDASIIKDVEPITYNYYHTVIKGKTPVNASTYINPNTNPGK